MKRMLLILAIAIALPAGVWADEAADLFGRLDRILEQSASYDAAYQSQIMRAKSQLQHSQGDTAELYNHNRRVFDLYHYYKADSALAYARAGRRMAEAMGRQDLVIASRIDEADILSRSGLFMQALARLDSIEPLVQSSHLVPYFFVRFEALQYVSEYLANTDFEQDYNIRKMQYVDSILLHTSPESFEYQTINACKLTAPGASPDSAITYLQHAVKAYQPGMREYSVLMSQLAYAHSLNADTLAAEKALALSAISDIMSSTMENTALRSLSTYRLEAGDIERANNYLSRSIEDANFYSARVRNLQSASVVPIVSNAYNHMRGSRERVMRISLVLLSALMLVIIFSIVIIIWQYRRLSANHDNLEAARRSVEEANERLNQVNAQLAMTNRCLTESSTLKEAYLNRFIWFSSATINHLESYRNRLYLLLKTNKRDELQATLTSTKDNAELLRDFYRVFDEAFLTIVPNFIQGLDDLLTQPLPRRKEESGELLTTEQRIYALIRMGMSDNQKLADFLHCSLSTIYTYRSKMRTRAKSPDDFEDQVLKIGLDNP